MPTYNITCSIDAQDLTHAVEALAPIAHDLKITTVAAPTVLKRRTHKRGVMPPHGGFTDANGRHCTYGDRVQYRYGHHYGTLGEVYQDGDADVKFDETGEWQQVKWKNLCKVEDEDARKE